MVLWRCLDCSTAFAVGQSRCPECGSTIYREDGEDMPKISKEGGDQAVTNTYAENEPEVQEMLKAEAAEGIIPADRVDMEARGQGDTGDNEAPYGATVQRADESSPTAPVEPVVEPDDEDSDEDTEDEKPKAERKTSAAGSSRQGTSKSAAKDDTTKSTKK